MDKRMEAAEESVVGGVGPQRADRAHPQSKPKGRRQKQVPHCPHPVLAAYVGVISHFLHGEFNGQLNAMEDPRDKDACRYAMSHMVWLGILLFSCRMGSREELGRNARDANFAETLNWLAGTDAATFEERHCAQCVASEGREGGPVREIAVGARG